MLLTTLGALARWRRVLDSTFRIPHEVIGTFSMPTMQIKADHGGQLTKSQRGDGGVTAMGRSLPLGRGQE